MSEYYVVLATEPTRHETLPEAMAELRVLSSHFPEKTFTIHRCKVWLNGAKHFTKMVELMRDLQRDGMTEDNSGRLRSLLQTIGTRTPKLETLIRTSGPDQYEPPIGARRDA